MRILFPVIAGLILITYSSCKKEDPNAIHVPGPPPVPTTAQVSSIQLNGGNVNGRWTMTFEQTVQYVNDTLQMFDTTTTMPGIYIVQFTGNELWIIDATFQDTTFYTYDVSGNVMTVHDGVDDIVFTYGVSSQGIMRWHFEETITFQDDLIRSYDDYLLERY